MVFSIADKHRCSHHNVHMGIQKRFLLKHTSEFTLALIRGYNFVVMSAIITTLNHCFGD